MIANDAEGNEFLAFVEIQEPDLKTFTYEALRISETFTRNINERPGNGQAKFTYFFDKEHRKGRYILWSDPAFAGNYAIFKYLSAQISAALESS